MIIPIDEVTLRSEIKSKYYNPIKLKNGACINGIYL